MKLHTNERFSYRFGLILFVSMCIISMRSGASEPGYDELFSYRYTAFTGFELSEEGVREALEQFDELGLNESIATIAVVGEQNYRSLTPYLKDIYNRRPDQAPNVIVAFKYTMQSLLEYFRVYVARALVRCGDPDGEPFAIEQALNSPNMGLVQSLYAIRTLKYLVLHLERDVSAELEFLIEIRADLDGRPMARYPARELVEIQKYYQLKSDVRESIYADAIDRQIQSADSKLEREFNQRIEQSRPSWKESLKLIDAQESDLGAR